MPRVNIFLWLSVWVTHGGLRYGSPTAASLPEAVLLPYYEKSIGVNGNVLVNQICNGIATYMRILQKEVRLAKTWLWDSLLFSSVIPQSKQKTRGQNAYKNMIVEFNIW